MSVMTKAMAPQAHVISQLRGAASAVEARRLPANAQGLLFIDAAFDLVMAQLEAACGITGDRLDPDSEWPGRGATRSVDLVEIQLMAWRVGLSYQRLELAFMWATWQMRRSFVSLVDGFRAERFCAQHPNGTPFNCGRCAAARRRAEVRAL